MSFCSRNFITFFLTQVIVGLMFAAIFSDWYSWTSNYTQKGPLTQSNTIQSVSSTTQLNYSNIYFNGTGYRVNVRTSKQTQSGQVASSDYYNWGGQNSGYAKVLQHRDLLLSFGCFFSSFLFRLPHFLRFHLLSQLSLLSLPAFSESTVCSFL